MFNLAIGNADGTVALKVSDNDLSGVSSLYGVKGKRYVKSYEAGLRRLDSLKLSNPPSVLVMDCEGVELDVLEGGKKTLASIPTVLAQPHVLSDGANIGPELKDRLKALDFENIEEFTPTSQNSWIIVVR